MKVKVTQDNIKDIIEFGSDYSYVNELFMRIAVIQFLIEDSDCLRCKERWYIYGEYLIEEFKEYSFQVMNK